MGSSIILDTLVVGWKVSAENYEHLCLKISVQHLGFMFGLARQFLGLGVSVPHNALE